MSDDFLPVPHESDVLAHLDFETPELLDTHDSLHLHFALVHAMYQLNITMDDLDLGTHKFATTERIADATQAVIHDEDGRDKVRAIVDELGEFAIEASGRFASLLQRKGIGGAHFFVYLPCHNGVAQYYPRNAAGRPEVIAW